MPKIQITNLTDGLHSYHFKETREQIGLGEDDRFVREIGIDLELDKSPGRFTTRTHVRTLGGFICDCCLDNFDLWVDQEIAAYYFQSAESVPENFKEEVKYLTSNTDTLDISEDVRDALLLSLPMKMLCRDACKGLCPTCGVNRNQETCRCPTEHPDPRWDALKKIRLDS